jgi:hypothetical protein
MNFTERRPEGRFVVAAAGSSKKHYNRHSGKVDARQSGCGVIDGFGVPTGSGNFIFLRPAVRELTIGWTPFRILVRPLLCHVGTEVPHQPTEFYLPTNSHSKVGD